MKSMNGLLTVLAAAGLAISAAAHADTTASYACKSGLRLQVRYAADTAEVRIGDAQASMILKQQMSGSGFRYADAGIELQGKGRDVTLTRASGPPPEQCSAVLLDQRQTDNK